MSHGLEIYDATGAALLTVSSRITRLIASYSGTVAANTTITVTVPGISLDGTWAVHLADNVRFVELLVISGAVKVKNMKGSESNTWTFLVFRY